jgi:DNA-binding NarL/FixJ family response regulator
VRTHVESVFRKLDCSTRAAATLKASTLGLI